MDKAQDYISQARKSGHLDTEIRRALERAGWDKALIEPLFTAAIPVYAPKKRHTSRFLLGILLILVIILSTTIIAFKTISNPQEGTTIPQSTIPTRPKDVVASPSAKPQNSIHIAPLVFVEGSASGSGVKLYNLATKTLISTPASISAETKSTPILGDYSPDGQHLPILFVRSSRLKSPLYFLNSMSKTETFLTDINKNAALRSTISLFPSSSSWTKGDTLVFSSVVNRKSQIVTKYSIDTLGTITSATASSERIVGNATLKVYEDTSASPSGTTRVTMQNKVIPSIPQGKVVGLIHNSLVSLLNTKKGTTQSASLSIPDTSINQELLLYSIADGKLQKSIPIGGDEWIAIDAQVRPLKNSVILHFQDKEKNPTQSQFVEMNVQTGKQVILTEELFADVRSNTDLAQIGSSFGITADGAWLVFYEPDIESNNKNKGNSILALNIDTKEIRTLCENTCTSFRVYNPERLTRM